jgi:hypothetical protein
MHARNTIYVHVDSTKNNHHFQLLVKMRGPNLEYSYRPFVTRLEPIVFPDFADLCKLQDERIGKKIEELMPMVLPPDEVGTYMHDNGLSETKVSVLWPG